MPVRTLTPPTGPTIRPDEFRQHLWNVYDGHDSDEELAMFTQAAVSAGETYCGRKFLARELALDGMSPGWHVLPFGDFLGLTGWDYVDAEGDRVEGDAAEVGVRRQGALSGFVEVLVPRKSGMTAARVRWRCGMAETPEDLPAEIRMGVKHTAAYWYNNRATAAQTGEVGDVRFLPETGRLLLDAYRYNLVPDAVLRRVCEWDSGSGGSGGGDTPATPVTLWSNAANIEVMAPETVTGKSKAWTWAPQTREHPECFDVPGDLTLTALEVLNEITNKWEDVSAEFDVSDVEHDGEAYRRYTDNRGYRAGERQIRITWR